MPVAAHTVVLILVVSFRERSRAGKHVHRHRSMGTHGREASMDRTVHLLPLF